MKTSLYEHYNLGTALTGTVNDKYLNPKLIVNFLSGSALHKKIHTTLQISTIKN